MSKPLRWFLVAFCVGTFALCVGLCVVAIWAPDGETYTAKSLPLSLRADLHKAGFLQTGEVPMFAFVPYMHDLSHQVTLVFPDRVMHLHHEDTRGERVSIPVTQIRAADLKESTTALMSANLTLWLRDGSRHDIEVGEFDDSARRLVHGLNHLRCVDPCDPKDASMNGMRSQFQTKLTRPPAAASLPPEPPPEASGLRLTKYPSAAGDLYAYLSRDPGDGARHPMMIWDLGGYGGIGRTAWTPGPADNDQSATAFARAGILMMYPSFRGENANPGRFELFYGEIDDLLAAIDYARSLPYVDPSRVYLGGHSTGGTTTLLAMTRTDKVRAAFSFGADVDLLDIHYGGYEEAPFDTHWYLERMLRSAVPFAKYIRKPVFYFEGAQEEALCESAQGMAARARRSNAPMRAFTVRGGDHFTILRPLTEMVAAAILADTGREWSASFTPEQVQSAFDARTP